MDTVGQDLGAAANGSDFVKLATIDAHAVFKDLGTHELFGQRLISVTKGFTIAGYGQADGVILRQLADLLANFGF